MVTLKNNFGVEPDKESVVMNVSEGSANDAKSSVSGHPKAILTCLKNSHPFQSRTLVLNSPAKIGRSVARARPSSYNGIFDCKVLSRNHAIIWYEYDTGKFMIQDTKSSNGTFVNNQRLSRGGETSSPREFFSRDVVQFGVDVLENQRKGNEESENSDESNHIVTHGCIIATVRLYHPNGKESESGQPYSSPNPMTPIPQEKICKLELIIHEAQQREKRLHDKLEELQMIISKLEGACQEALTNRFEETRLLSKIESLEKQIRVMNKVMTGSSGKSEGELQQLLVDIEKVQSVAREIQERQHRKLLESEQKLVEAQRVASNLELEVTALRKQASLAESHLQDMGIKCTSYCQTIESLKTNFHTQMVLTQKLEAELAKFEEREFDRDLKMSFSELDVIDKYKFISNESEEDIVKKDVGDGQEVILERCKNFDDSDKLEDFINENDKTEWFSKKLFNLSDAISSGLENISNCVGQLEKSLSVLESSKKNIEALSAKQQELALQLEAARMSVEENEKTENDLDGEKHELAKPVILTSLSNEKITELENELKEQEEWLNQERLRQKEWEGKCTKSRCELDAAIKRCEKLNLKSCKLKTLLSNHLKSLEETTTLYRQQVAKLESEREELENGQEQKLIKILRDKKMSMEGKETQTSIPELVSSSTNTEIVEEPEPSVESVPSPVTDAVAVQTEKPLEKSKTNADLVDSPDTQELHLDKSSPVEVKEETKVTESSITESRPEEKGTEWPAHNLGVWEKIQKMQKLTSIQPSATELYFSNSQVNEMRNLTNLIAEDLVHLLLREQQMSKDKENLQERLNKSAYKQDPSALGLAMHMRTIMLFSVTAVVAYFVCNIFL